VNNKIYYNQKYIKQNYSEYINFAYLRNSGKLNDYIILERQYYYSKADLQIILHELKNRNEVKGLLSTKDLADTIKCSKHLINTMEKRGVIHYKSIFAKVKYYDSETLEIARKYYNKIQKSIEKWEYTITKLSEIYSITPDQVRNLIKKYNIKPSRTLFDKRAVYGSNILVFFNKAYPISKKEYHDLIRAEEIMKKYKFSRNELYRRIALSKVAKYTFGGRIYIYKNQVQSVLDDTKHYQSLHQYSKKYKIELNYLLEIANKGDFGTPIIYHGRKFYDPKIVEPIIYNIRESLDEQWHLLKEELMKEYPDSKMWSSSEVNSPKTPNDEKVKLIKDSSGVVSLSLLSQITGLSKNEILELEEKKMITTSSITIQKTRYYPLESLYDVFTYLGKDVEIFTISQLAERYHLSEKKMKEALIVNNIKHICFKEGSYYYSANSIRLLEKKYKKRMVNLYNSFTAQEVMDKFNLTYSELKKLTKLCDITPFFSKGCRYYTEEMCEILTDEESIYRPLDYYCEKYDVERKLLEQFAINGKFGDVIVYNEGKYYNPKAVKRNIIHIKNEKEKEKREYLKEYRFRIGHFRECSGTHEIMEKGFEIFNPKLVHLKPIIQEFILSRIQRIREDKIKTKVIGLINTMNRLSYYSEGKEFFDLAEEDIEELLKGDKFSTNECRNIVSLLKYLQLNYPNQMNNSFSLIVNRNKPDKHNKEIYTEDEWLKLFSYINDINLHCEKAIKSEKYSKMWLLIMLHMFLTWRLMDFAKFPYPEVSIIGDQYVLDFEKEKITLNDVILLVNDITEKCKDLVSNKTNKRLAFTSPILHLGVSFGAAILIAEMHRRNTNSESLLNHKDCSKYKDHIKSCKIFRNFQIKDFTFGSLKANRSLATYEFKIASKMPEKLAIALNLVGFGRSHAFGDDGIPRTSVEYVCLTRGDGGTFDELSIALQSRGYGGFLYEDILSIVSGGNSFDVNFMEKTDIIKSLHSKFPLLEAENITGYILCQGDRKKASIEKLKNMGADFESILKKLVNNELPSKEIGIQCLDYCKYPFSNECKSCENAILPIYSLFEIKDKIHCIITKMKSTNKNKTNELKQYSYDLLRFIELFNIFYKEYSFLNAEFSKKVFGWQEIKDEVHQLLLEDRLSE
jgi:hypothetical protein